ncbi:MAG: TraB family protein, partial [Candidatus Aenigmatarchaeota archaeon]
EMGTSLPELRRVLIDERDIYIANKIGAAPGKKIVVVVGAGHVNGIKNHLRKKEDIAPLDKVPSGGRWMKRIGYLVPLVFLGIIAYGFYANASLDVTYNMVLWWFLINGALSALGAIIALGHPLTVLAAFIAAPFTSLNPTIGAGMVAGLVEAKVRMPRVRDFEALGEIASVSGFYKNRVSRILLVAALANLGSMIGTFIALPYIMSLI